MSEWVNLAYSENNATTNRSVRLITLKQIVHALVENNPYVTLTPHQIVVFCPPRCYGTEGQTEERHEP